MAQILTTFAKNDVGLDVVHSVHEFALVQGANPKTTLRARAPLRSEELLEGRFGVSTLYSQDADWSVHGAAMTVVGKQQLTPT